MIFGKDKGNVPVSVAKFPVSSEKFPVPVRREIAVFLLIHKGKTNSGRIQEANQHKISLYFPVYQGI